MANLTFQQIEQLWIQAGGKAEWAPTMAAIAIGAESGGDPTATNPSGATGLWQIEVPGSSGGYTAAQLMDPLTNAKRAVQLLGDGSGISNWGSGTGDAIGTAVQANGNKPLTPQQAQQYATNPPTNATLTSAVTTASSTPAVPNIGTEKDAPLVPGANIHNFHGYDLSAIPSNQLGNAESAIQHLVVNPNAKDANGLTLNQRLEKDFGYTTSFINKLPPAQRSQVEAVLIWGSQYIDPSDANSKAQYDSALAQTNWYKTTSQYQRAWQELQGTDPATAQKQLAVAQDKVLATANQIGVKLSAQQLHQIANNYAAQSYTPTGTYSSLSGTSQEWLDQAVVNAVTDIGKGGAPSDLMAQGAGGTTGIASALYQQFQQVAQQYLMYNPNGKGLLTSDDLMKQVNTALQSYTGTGASGQISQFEAGALNAFTEQMKTQASQMYPSLAAAIAQGTAPADYVKPQASLIANTLGLDPSSIDFTSPQWNWAIASPDPKTNQKVALTQDQIQQKITDPGFTFQGPDGKPMTYLQTNNGQQLQNQFAGAFASAFGKGG